MMAARSQQLKRSLKPIELEDSSARRRSLVDKLIRCLKNASSFEIGSKSAHSRRRVVDVGIGAVRSSLT
jgi:hypothetical protein